MKRSLLLFSVVVAAALASAGSTTVVACQYCRMAALADPEGGRTISDNKGGAFPLDGAIGQYQAAPVEADLKTAPAADSVVTSASALTAPLAPGAVAATVIHRSVLPPPLAKPVAASQADSTQVKNKVAPSVASTVLAHWTDACLLGLAAAGGVFWRRTRRLPADSSN